MKTNMTRILCLVLVLLMSVTVFAACKDTEDDVTKTNVTDTDVTSVPENVMVEVDDSAPYAIAKDANGKDIVILTPNDDGTVTMTVAEKTTLEAFLAVVTAKEGYTIKVTDAEGKEVTDTKALIAKGMVFEVYADGASEAAEKMTIDVVTADVIESTVQEQSKIDKIESQIKQESKVPTSNTSSQAPSSSSQQNTPGSTTEDDIEIVMASLWQALYTASDATGKAWQSTLTNMESKQGIKTTINPLDASSATDLIVKEVMAGNSSADVFDISIVMCRDVARKKASANIYASKTLDKSLYQSASTTSVTFSGKAYGVAFPAKSVNPMGVIYNKDMIQKYAKDYDIVKLYNEKKWNFDNFQAIAKLCTQDTNGDGRTDVYGFTSNTNIIGMALTANAGGTALMVNGRVEATMCNEAGIAALEWCKTMFRTDKSWNYKSDINACITEFTGGKAAMFVSYMQYYPQIAAQASFPLGFVLMPIGPAQTDYMNGVYDGSVYVVPKTKESRLDDIGRWMNGMAAVGSKLINLKTTDMARNGLDATSQSIYRWLVNNMTPEFSSGVFSASIDRNVGGCVTNAASSPSKVMNSIRSQAQKECDDYFADLY